MAKSFSELKLLWESGSISENAFKEPKCFRSVSHLPAEDLKISVKTVSSDLDEISRECFTEEEVEVSESNSSEECSSEREGFEDESYLGIDTEGFLGSGSYLQNNSSSSSDSFSEQLRQLESSLKFDSPEKWLFGSMASSSCISYEPNFDTSSCNASEKSGDTFALNEIDGLCQIDHDANLLSEGIEMPLQQLDCILKGNLDQQQRKMSFSEDFSYDVSLHLPFCDDLPDRRLRKNSLRRRSSSLSIETVQSIPGSLLKAVLETASDDLNKCRAHSEHRRTSSALAPLCYDGSSRLLEAFEVKIERDRKSVDGDGVQARKMAARQSKVIQELLDTEITYQTHLALVIKYFEWPLQKKKILSDQVVATIFGNIEQLMAINTELLIHLKSLSVGEAFCRLGPFLKLYSTYANNHERALASLMEWDLKCPEFAKFRRTQEELPEMKGLKLNALLITPVQRIPRYKLLLEELFLCTSPSHKDYKSIGEAVKLVSAVASHINEHIKQQDNFMKMLAIQRSISGPPGLQILIPGRVFIKEGMLHKVSKKGGCSRERLFLLFSDVLMYAKPRLLDSAGSNSFICCCILPLLHCKVDQVLGHSQGQGSLFSIQCKDELLLLFSDQKTVTSWMNVLQKAIDEMQSSRHSLRKNSSAKEPLRGDVMIQYLKKEKKTDPLTAKINSRSCFAAKQNVKQKKSSERQKLLKSDVAAEDSVNEKLTTNASNGTPKKSRLGFACLSKHRQKVFPEFGNWKFVKGSPFAKENCSMQTNNYAHCSGSQKSVPKMSENTNLLADSPKIKFGNIQNQTIAPAATANNSRCNENFMAKSTIDFPVGAINDAPLLHTNFHLCRN